MQQDTLGDLGNPQLPTNRPVTQQDVEALYQTLLGRSVDPTGLAAHLRNPEGLAGVERAIRESDEFKKRGTATPAAANAFTGGQQRTGWGFNSPTGGRAEFSYTDTDYGRDTSGFYDPHYRDTGAAWDTSDPGSYDSTKRLGHRIAAGLGSTFDEAALDAWVARMNAAGIPVRKVDAYQVDFGTGEGPIQVRHSSDKFWWNNRATEGLGTLAQPQTVTPTTTVTPMAPTGPTSPTAPPDQTDAGAPTPTPGNEAAAQQNAPASGETMRGDASTERYIEQNIVPMFESQGVEVLQIVGDKVLIVTPDDRAAGRTQGQWVDVIPDETPSSGALGDLGQPV